MLLAIFICIGNGFAATSDVMTTLALVALLGLAVESVGLLFHRNDLQRNGGEGAASYYEQATTFGKSYWLRNGLLLINLIAVAVIAFVGLSGLTGAIAGITLVASILAANILGRALFYVLVIPTTMPGAFFWRNKGFEEHARETGLANMPQLGVVPNSH